MKVLCRYHGTMRVSDSTLIVVTNNLSYKMLQKKQSVDVNIQSSTVLYPKVLLWQISKNIVPCNCFLSEGCAKHYNASITILSWLMVNALYTLSEYLPLLRVPACCCHPGVLISSVTCEVPFLHLYGIFPLSSSLVVQERHVCSDSISARYAFRNWLPS